MKYDPETIQGNRDSRALFRSHQHRNLEPQERLTGAQLAISYIIQAFRGLISPKKIKDAVGNAKDPNAVSRALRSRLNSGKIKF